MNTGEMSHSIDYRVAQVIPNHGKLISWTHINPEIKTVERNGYIVKMYSEGMIEVIYENNGEMCRTHIKCKRAYKRIYK